MLMHILRSVCSLRTTEACLQKCLQISIKVDRKLPSGVPVVVMHEPGNAVILAVAFINGTARKYLDDELYVGAQQRNEP